MTLRGKNPTNLKGKKKEKKKQVLNKGIIKKHNYP
jgi:hypothetical protein